MDRVAVENWAQALYSAAEKAQQLDTVLAEGATLREIYGRQKKMAAFLEGPQFRTQDKHQLLNRVFRDQLNKLLLSTLHLLVDKDRINHLPEILERVAELYDEERGFVRGTVVTAIPLSYEGYRYLQENLEKYSGVKFHFDFEVDTKIIGGVRVKYGDVLLDTTIRSQLDQLRGRLSHVKVV